MNMMASKAFRNLTKHGAKVIAQTFQCNLVDAGHIGEI